MDRETSAAVLLKEARKRAGLTQRELARRAGTAQSVVARVESGQSSPSLETLENLIQAAGFELKLTIVPRLAAGSHMLEDVARILHLSPEQRLIEVRNFARFVHDAGHS